MNARGDIVGYSADTAGARRATLWASSGALVDLGALPGGDLSQALGINNAGVIVGTSTSSAGDRACLWTPGGRAPGPECLDRAVLVRADPCNGHQRSRRDRGIRARRREPRTDTPRPAGTTTRTSFRFESSCSCPRERGHDDTQASLRARAVDTAARAGSAVAGRRCARRSDQIGQWDKLTPDLPFFPVHAHLLPTGKVMIWPGDGGISGNDPRLWDPASDTDKPHAACEAGIRPLLRRPRVPRRWAAASSPAGISRTASGLAKASLYDPFLRTTWCRGARHERGALVSHGHDAGERRCARRLRVHRQHGRDEHAAAGLPGGDATRGATCRARNSAWTCTR